MSRLKNYVRCAFSKIGTGLRRILLGDVWNKHSLEDSDLFLRQVVLRLFIIVVVVVIIII